MQNKQTLSCKVKPISTASSDAKKLEVSRTHMGLNEDATLEDVENATSGISNDYVPNDGVWHRVSNADWDERKGINGGDDFWVIPTKDGLVFTVKGVVRSDIGTTSGLSEFYDKDGKRTSETISTAITRPKDALTSGAALAKLSQKKLAASYEVMRGEVIMHTDKCKKGSKVDDSQKFDAGFARSYKCSCYYIRLAN